MATSRIAALLNERELLGQQYRADLAKCHQQIVEAVRASVFPCRECGRKSRLGHCSFITKQAYDYNTRSPNGGFWYASGHKYSDVVCPKCKGKNYLYSHPKGTEIVRWLNEVKPSDVFVSVTSVKLGGDS